MKHIMHDLLSKYVSGEASPLEKQLLFQQLKESEELRKEAVGIQNLSALVAMAEAQALASDRQYRSFVHLRKKRSFLFHLRRVAGYAALVVFSVLSTYLCMLSLGNGSNQQARYQEFATPPGQRARVLLGDGTEVWLNANSTLRYPEFFSMKHREVELRGEAFFDVEKDEKKPFIVKTNKMNIEVTGTAFNVHAYEAEERAVVSLLDGAVSVRCGYDPERSHVLHPQQQLVVSGNSSTISSFDNTDFLSWREGVFVFDDMPFADIIKKLELYYDVSIDVKNSRLSAFRYTGKFRQRDGVESVLRKLQIVYPFTYTKDDEQNRIFLQ